MPDRSGGAAGRVILGTMRLHEIDRSVEAWADFFVAAHAMGVVTLHSSMEYVSFTLLRRILARIAHIKPQIHFRHMVKLGEPHFDEEGFSTKRLRDRLDDYRKALGVDRIADVQWMWRHGVREDDVRVARFRSTASLIADSAKSLKDGGVIERFMCFPYTPPFADAALDAKAIDGLVVYRNAAEIEYDAVLDRSAALGKPCIAIRPFFGGKLVKDGTTDPVALVRFVLNKPAIEAVVVSTSNFERLKQVAECCI